MIVSIIAAVDSNWTIGNRGKLPWPRIRNDLQYFKQKTMGKPIIMSRKTFESLASPLSERTNIILTRDPDFSVRHSECVVVHSVKDALAKAGYAKEVMVIGGAEIFKLFMPYVDRMYLTFVLGKFEGDTRFPKFEFFGKNAEWKEDETKQILVERSGNDPPFDLCFSVFERQHSKTERVN